MSDKDIKIYDGTKLPDKGSNRSMIEVKKKEIHEFFSSPVCMNQLKKSLPRVGITADRMVRIMFSSIAQIPKLANCSTRSLFNVMIQCAQIGLEPNTALGHAYIIPYGSSATLIIGYKGLIELCRRSKEFASIYAHEVYPDDVFEILLGTESSLKHIPNYNVSYEEQELIGCYAVAKFKDGSYMFEYMPKHDIDKIRARSVSANNGPWVSDYMMMARKTVIRRLMHYLPLTIEMAEAVKADGENEVGILPDYLPEEEKEEEKNKEVKQEEEKQTHAEAKKETSKEQKKAPKNDQSVVVNKKDDFDLYMMSFEVRGISATEVLAYFMCESEEELKAHHLDDLKIEVQRIESEKITPEEFKKTAAERFEMSLKEKK